jgi:hypothetical protein
VSLIKTTTPGQKNTASFHDDQLQQYKFIDDNKVMTRQEQYDSEDYLFKKSAICLLEMRGKQLSSRTAKTKVEEEKRRQEYDRYLSMCGLLHVDPNALGQNENQVNGTASSSHDLTQRSARLRRTHSERMAKTTGLERSDSFEKGQMNRADSSRMASRHSSQSSGPSHSVWGRSRDPPVEHVPERSHSSRSREWDQTQQQAFSQSSKQNSSSRGVSVDPPEQEQPSQSSSGRSSRDHGSQDFISLGEFRDDDSEITLESTFKDSVAGSYAVHSKSRRSSSEFPSGIGRVPLIHRRGSGNASHSRNDRRPYSSTYSILSKAPIPEGASLPDGHGHSIRYNRPTNQQNDSRRDDHSRSSRSSNHQDNRSRFSRSSRHRGDDRSVSARSFQTHGSGDTSLFWYGPEFRDVADLPQDAVDIEKELVPTQEWTFAGFTVEEIFKFASKNDRLDIEANDNSAHFYYLEILHGRAVEEKECPDSIPVDERIEIPRQTQLEFLYKALLHKRSFRDDDTWEAHSRLRKGEHLRVNDLKCLIKAKRAPGLKIEKKIEGLETQWNQVKNNYWRPRTWLNEDVSLFNEVCRKRDQLTALNRQQG